MDAIPGTQQDSLSAPPLQVPEAPACQDAPLVSGAAPGLGAAGWGAVQAVWVGGGPTHSAGGAGQLPS